MNVIVPLATPVLRQERRAAPGATSTETAFTAIRIEGGLFPAEFLQRIAALTAPGQSAEDYGVPPGRTLRDEIGRYWTIAEALWKDYRQNRRRSDIAAERTGVERWLVRLFRDVLGYADINPTASRASVGDRSFPISHRVHGQAVPLLLTVADRELDRSHPSFGDEGRRRAPHAAVQEYLNADAECLWGIVANGPRLRLLRDNPSLTRPAYIEADLERIFEEGLYADFATLWLVAHASRFAPGANVAGECWLERWRAEGAKTGQRALEKLRAGVTEALRELGSGFIEHADNDTLRAALRDGKLTAEALHQQLLRLVYRLLLLFTAEERDVLHAPDATPEARSLYAQGYAVARLRDRARLKRHYDRYADLWAGLKVTFIALGQGTWLLGLPALGGLFDEAQCPDLDAATLSNTRLLTAVHALAFFTDAGSLQRVNYRDMGAEELGSVYESLLELFPVIQVETRPWIFGFVCDDAGGTTKGNARKLSGSYYTPDSLVQELLRSALDPVIERAIRDNPTNPREAVLRLRVLDPACGSGHFLLGAARRLADAVARLDSEGDLPDEALRRHALREVVRRCIFGVDRNPLSVELCKTALWIEAIEPGKPLSFLDAHIKCGDSLIGVADLSVLKAGIPDEAFKDLTGDHKTYARDLRKRNKAERENPVLALLPELSLSLELSRAIAALVDAPEDTLDDVAQKRRTLADIESGPLSHDLRVACDLWCAAFFAPRTAPPEMRGRDLVPTTDAVWRYRRGPSLVYGPMLGVVEELRARLRFFHWPLEFPDVFGDGGFDCVLGNPPWERIKLQEQEFFAARSEQIAKAPNAAARRACIAALAKGDASDRALHRSFEDAKRDAEGASQFVRGCGRFPLTAVGDVNTYALFAEAFLHLPKVQGRTGLIVPSGIATDDSTKAFFNEIIEKQRLASLYDFENREAMFPEVHRSYKFSLITICGNEPSARFVFFAASVAHLADARRAFTLTPHDIRLINPNTRTCPVFRSSADAELTRRIYARVPVLTDETRGPDGNPWRIKLRTMLHKTNDAASFVPLADVPEAKTRQANTTTLAMDGSRVLPIYEGELGWQFDHRYATVIDGELREAPPDWKAQSTSLVTAELYLREADFHSRLERFSPASKSAFLGFRRVARSTDLRTSVAAIFPFVPSTYGWIIVDGADAVAQGVLSAAFNSLVFDYLLRNALSQPSIPQGTFQQVATPPPAMVRSAAQSYIITRVLELTYTANDMRPWAEDVGYDGRPFGWDEERRAHLRAELDAAYAYLYGLTRDELRYILDPADIYGADFPSETFRVLKEREIKQHGEYRTARLVLAAWDRMTADGTFARFNAG